MKGSMIGVLKGATGSLDQSSYALKGSALKAKVRNHVHPVWAGPYSVGPYILSSVSIYSTCIYVLVGRDSSAPRAKVQH